MARGCIPVVSDLPANREWINDGVNGVIVGDFDSGFLKRMNEIDFETAMEINKGLIQVKASRKVSVKNFSQLYNELIKVDHAKE
jgi:glycosyltransferase involved in cell wall biosynthesis